MSRILCRENTQAPGPSGGFVHQAQALATLVLAIVIFGTVGVLRRYIPLPSGVVSAARGLLGMGFLLGLLRLKGKGLRAALREIEKHLPLLCLSGGMMGLCWLLILEAFRTISVGVASVCYYMEPIFIILGSHFLFGERLTMKKSLCVAAAFAGVAMVSGVIEAGPSGFNELKGPLLALGSGGLYAAVTLMNKAIGDVPLHERTALQLGVAGAMLLVWSHLTGELYLGSCTPAGMFCLLIMGVIQTGLAYGLYFGALRTLSAQTVAILSYIDPITSVALSALILGEGLTPVGMAGAALVIGAAIIAEL